MNKGFLTLYNCADGSAHQEQNRAFLERETARTAVQLSRAIEIEKLGYMLELSWGCVPTFVGILRDNQQGSRVYLRHDLCTLNNATGHTHWPHARRRIYRV